MAELVFFKDSSPLSKRTTYQFSVPKYPETTTDGSFYEPQATRIQNMKKSASSSNQGIYDFYDDEIKGNDVSRYHDQVMNRLNTSETVLGRKPGLTAEEVMSVMSRTVESVEDNSKKQSKADRKKEVEKLEQIENAKTIVKAISQDSAEE